MNKPTATYDESCNLVEVTYELGYIVLTPNQTYALYLALRDMLAELPQPLNPEAP
jgi:hypothetical protein